MSKSLSIDVNRLRTVVSSHRRALSDLRELEDRLAIARSDLRLAERAKLDASRAGGFVPVDQTSRKDARTSVIARADAELGRARDAYSHISTERDAAAERARSAGNLAERCRDYCRQNRFPIPRDCES